MAPVVRCVLQDCRKELEESWNFCPRCGTDNRPPEHRPPIGTCVHEYINGKGFCVLCGQAFPKPKVMPWAWGQGTVDNASDAPKIDFGWDGGCFLTEGWGLGCMVVVWIITLGIILYFYLGQRQDKPNSTKAPTEPAIIRIMR